MIPSLLEVDKIICETRVSSPGSDPRRTGGATLGLADMRAMELMDLGGEIEGESIDIGHMVGRIPMGNTVKKGWQQAGRDIIYRPSP